MINKGLKGVKMLVRLNLEVMEVDHFMCRGIEGDESFIQTLIIKRMVLFHTVLRCVKRNTLYLLSMLSTMTKHVFLLNGHYISLPFLIN